MRESSPDLASEARQFTRGQQNGVLSTLSRRLEGFPFGSVTPFMLDHAGHPVLLISDIAEHTKNITADNRVSLIVQPFSHDMQETARVTLLGHALPVSDAEQPKEGPLGARYLRYFPQAEAYFGMHDFRFYRIEPVRIRYIGGFGRIHWLEAANWTCDTGTLADSEGGILAHMNADHADNLKQYCAQVHGITPDAAMMTGIDPDGFDVRIQEGAASRLLRFHFETHVLNAEAARAALVALARKCR
jgi:heme iron utilization protein